MTSAKIVSFLLPCDESFHSLQSRIERETGISTASQELLSETGISLDPRKPASQCVLDGVVREFVYGGEGCGSGSCNIAHNGL